MTTISAFKLLFGNIIGFNNWAKNQLKSDSIEELNTLFYRIFRECIDKEKRKSKISNKIVFQQLKLLAQIHKETIITFFNAEVSILV